MDVGKGGATHLVDEAVKALAIYHRLRRVRGEEFKDDAMDALEKAMKSLDV